MSLLEVTFKVMEEYACPLYEVGNEFRLDGNALNLPYDRPACMILMNDIAEKCAEIEESRSDEEPQGAFECSGCTGNIRMAYEKEKEYIFDIEFDSENAKDNIARLLSGFSFFKTLSKQDIKYFVSFIRMKQVDKGEIILRKGEPGRNLFILLSGTVEILGENDINIAFLGKGEIFGEMSLLSGEPVGATVKAVEASRVLYLNSRNFRRLLHRFPPLQMYFARLLSKRLAKTNVARSEEIESSMTGKLTDLPPSELLQTFNQNRKTGVLTFELSDGNARISFKEGELVDAQYGDLLDKEAFWEILKKREGRFKFVPGLPPEKQENSEIGHFMWLLMEGLSRIDEESFEKKKRRKHSD